MMIIVNTVGDIEIFSYTYGVAKLSESSKESVYSELRVRIEHELTAAGFVVHEETGVVIRLSQNSEIFRVATN